MTQSLHSLGLTTAQGRQFWALDDANSAFKGLRSSPRKGPEQEGTQPTEKQLRLTVKIVKFVFKLDSDFIFRDQYETLLEKVNPPKEKTEIHVMTAVFGRKD